MDYSILLKDHNCYVISDKDKTATLVTLGESDLKSLIDTQFFSGLQYINTTDGKYKGKNKRAGSFLLLQPEGEEKEPHLKYHPLYRSYCGWHLHGLPAGVDGWRDL